MTADVLQVRLDDHARRLADLERTQPAVIAKELEALAKDVAELHDDVKAQTRALYTTALSVMGAALIFAFTAFQIWGGP